jgi:hypothetical protein
VAHKEFKVSYQPGLRDPNEHSAIASAGLTENTVGRIFLEEVKGLFMDPDGFQVYEMRNHNPTMRWDPDVSKSRVKIVRAEDWDPKTGGVTPEVVIRTQGTNWAWMNNAGMLDVPEDEMEDPDYIAYRIVGRVVIWSVSAVVDEVKMMGWEISQFLGAFAKPLCREWGFDNLQPAAVGPPVHLAECKEAWGVPVALALAWQCVQAVNQQSVPLAEVLLGPRKQDSNQPE